jgi:prolyl-tRNA synthetase
MRQTQLFTKTRREAPKDEISRNAELLIRAGYIHKEMAGVYSYLPLGLRTLNKIINIIREEMNNIGGQELHLASLQDRSSWQATNRWNDDVVDVWFKTKLKNDTELGLGFTHEEPLTALMKDHIRSFRDLPLSVYQFQTKFRNETRAKSGIMRTREFLMKDLYSFCPDENAHAVFYEKAKNAYTKVFERVGLGDETYVTFASGGSFSKYSHEFQTLTDSGEDSIFVHKQKKIAINKEVLSEAVLSDLGIKREDLQEKKAVEVGNIFSLGTKFSDALNLVYKDEAGNTKPVIMGSYGIGPGRVMGTVAELKSDKNGLMWPRSIAPFQVHIIALFDESGEVRKICDEMYDKLTMSCVEVLYDDRVGSAGEKFSDADLIGIPLRVVVSQKTLANSSVEVKDRITGEVSMLPLAQYLEKLS